MQVKSNDISVGEGEDDNMKNKKNIGNGKSSKKVADNKKEAKIKEAKEDDDDKSDEDSDYAPNNVSDDSDDSDDSDSEGNAIKAANYSKIENTHGGLVKTRRQRLEESSKQQEAQLINTKQSSLDIDSIWNEMKSSTIARDTTTELKSTDDSTSEEKIKIVTSYEYAGETIKQDKWVLSSSAEAKAYLNSVKLKTESQQEQKKQEQKKQQQQQVQHKSSLKRRRPKSSLVDSIIKGEKMAKLSTLEKSRLDWANYVDRNKLGDELKSHNKDGYLSKQDFLSQVESNVESRMKGKQS